ncbi:MAG: hypothetical protein E3J70_11505, partial [Candidatus Heimdallarchaeota archaeon]
MSEEYEQPSEEHIETEEEPRYTEVRREEEPIPPAPRREEAPSYAKKIIDPVILGDEKDEEDEPEEEYIDRVK